MKWKTKSGELIEISEMSDRHLLNTIKWLERNAERLRTRTASAADGYSAMTNGEMASFYLEKEAVAMYEMDGNEWLERYCPEYSEMIDEQIKRKLF